MIRNMVVREAVNLSENLLNAVPTTQNEAPAQGQPAQTPSVPAAPSTMSSEAGKSDTVDTDTGSSDPDAAENPEWDTPTPINTPVDTNAETRSVSVSAAVVRMLHHMGNIFRDVTVRDSTYGGLQIDRQRRRELQELRGALGHPEDDHEDETLYHVNDPQSMQ